MKTFSVKNLSQLPEVAKDILEFAKEKFPSLGEGQGMGYIFCFYGELGAGKTTLIKTICKSLNAKDSGSSPTFGLVNEYKTNFGNTLYHFDFYRIKNETEAFDFGFEEYLQSGNYCFIEWPEKIERLLPKDYVRVKIDVKNEERIISIS